MRHILHAVAVLASAATAHAQTTLNGGGAVTPEPTYASEFSQFTQANPGVLFSYAGVGDTGGQNAFLTDTISHFRNLKPGTPSYGTEVGNQVTFSASDTALTAGQLTDPATGGYTRSATDGPLIQLPMVGVGIVFPFVNAGLSSTLVLTDDQICGVLSGKIKDWSMLDPSATPGPITISYFYGDNGLTYYLTNHLNAVCTAANSTFPTFPVPVTTKFINLFAGGKPPKSFQGQNTSADAQAFLLATPLSFGYLTPDYTSIAPKSAHTSSLMVASVVNASNGKVYAPTVGNIKAGLAKPGTGSSHVTPPSTQSDAMNPLNWIPSVPQTAGGYPIVGYTTWEVSTCYADPVIASDLVSFLNVHFRNKAYQTLVSNNGFAPVSNTATLPYVSAITNIFLTNASGYNLNIGNKTSCAGLAGR